MTGWVSVCIPTYNAEETLPDTIQSVIDQTHSDWELIIADDGSADRTVEVARSFDDPRIVVHPAQANVGMAANFDRALDLGRFAYRKLLCADDLLEPTAVEHQLSILLENPSVALTAARRNIIDDQGHVISANRGVPDRFIGRHDGPTIARRVVRSGYNPLGEPASVLFLASAKEAAGSFSAALSSSMDIEMWIRMLRFGDFYGSAETLASFRLHSGSFTANHFKDYGRQDRSFFRSVAADPHWGVSRSALANGIIRSSLSDVHRSWRMRHSLR
ncbi:MAG: glycosyltransferase family 2 protein [Acidimicrobiales bacterium]